MSAASRNRSLRSLEALVSIREAEEKQALQRVAQCRLDFESCNEHVNMLRQQRHEATRHLEVRDPADTEFRPEGSGKAVVRDRAFIDQLRTREKVKSTELNRLRRAWESSQERFCEARSRRRVSESLRDRRSKEVQERNLASSERLVEVEGYRKASEEWLEAPQL